MTKAGYTVIEKKDLKKINQYNWFGTFSDPCYGFNVKVDVTRLVKYSKESGTSFFVNTLYLVTSALNTIDEMRMRKVGEEIRLYDEINPTFTVMTDVGLFENAGFEMINDYKGFYGKAKEVLNEVKQQTKVKETYNDSALYNDYYITCIPWLSMESMTHPLPDNNPESSSVPRICWDRFREENGRTVMTLNITVSHCFVDGYPLAMAFKRIQEYFDNLVGICD